MIDVAVVVNLDDVVRFVISVVILVSEVVGTVDIEVETFDVVVVAVIEVIVVTDVVISVVESEVVVVVTIVNDKGREQVADCVADVILKKKV